MDRLNQDNNLNIDDLEIMIKESLDLVDNNYKDNNNNIDSIINDFILDLSHK
jgi:hypothetical protein